MLYKPGDIVRAALFILLPLAAGVLARAEEVAWGAALVAVLALVPRVRPHGGALAAGFGLLVLARVGARISAGGVTAVFIGLAAIGLLAYVVVLLRRRPPAPAGQWASALTALAVLAATAIAALYARLHTLSLVFAPLAVLILVAATLGLARGGRAPLVALTAGVVLGGLKIGLAFALIPAAENALARGDLGGAARYAGYASLMGAGAGAEVVSLEAAAARGDDWAALERRYDGRDPYGSSRPLDAVLARAAFRRGDLERAAMYGDLATTAGPASPFPARPMKRAELAADFRKMAAAPAERGWVEVWAGRPVAALACYRQVPGTAGIVGSARAWEHAGDPGRAAHLYESAWRAEPADLDAAFGLLRTREYVGLRGEVWSALGEQYPGRRVGAELDAVDGMVISKNRRSLGRTPATMVVKGPGRRRLAVIAEAQPAYGLYPMVVLTVNGRPLRRWYLSESGEGLYAAVVDLPSNSNILGLWFENDFADAGKGVDRNVFIREIRMGHG